MCIYINLIYIIHIWGQVKGNSWEQSTVKFVFLYSSLRMTMQKQQLSSEIVIQSCAFVCVCLVCLWLCVCVCVCLYQSYIMGWNVYRPWYFGWFYIMGLTHNCMLKCVSVEIIRWDTANKTDTITMISVCNLYQFLDTMEIQTHRNTHTHRHTKLKNYPPPPPCPILLFSPHKLAHLCVCVCVCMCTCVCACLCVLGGREWKHPSLDQLNSYCADGAYLHHENIVSKKMS